LKSEENENFNALENQETKKDLETEEKAISNNLSPNKSNADLKEGIEHKKIVNAIKQVSNSDSEYAVEHFLSSNENNNLNMNSRKKESPEKKDFALNKLENQNEINKEDPEKTTIFINNAILNTNQSKLKNLFEENKPVVLPKENISKNLDEENNRMNNLHTNSNLNKNQITNSLMVSSTSNFEFGSKPTLQPDQQFNTNKNLIQESSTNISYFNNTQNAKKPETFISVENNSFDIYSIPKKENIITSNQSHHYISSSQNQQNKFNSSSVTSTTKNTSNLTNTMPSTNTSSLNNNSNTNSNILNSQNTNNFNLNKTQNQTQQMPKNDNMSQQTNNPLNMNLSSPNNYPYNPNLIPSSSMQADLNNLGFSFPGTNALQQGFYPMFWYYPPSQGGSLDQSYLQGVNSNSSTQMPFMPYPMPYYVNPYMFGQMDNKENESSSNSATNKGRKNNYYPGVSGYQGMNANVNILLLKIKKLYFKKLMKMD